MKRPNKHVTRVVTGTLATSILVASCEGVLTDQSSDQIYNVNTMLKSGENAITINRSPEEQAYILFLQKLSWDVINDPAVASKFSQNPALYLQQYGYNQSVNLDEGMLKLILALGDYDINTAIKNNDIKTLLSLMKSKNLLTKPSNVFMHISN